MDISPVVIVLLLLGFAAFVGGISFVAYRSSKRRSAPLPPYRSTYLPLTAPPAAPGGTASGGRSIPGAGFHDAPYRFGPVPGEAGAVPAPGTVPASGAAMAAVSGDDSADKSEALYSFYRDVPPACCPSCGVEYPGSLSACPVCGQKR